MIARMIRSRRVAVVGLSDNPSRPSFGVARYLVSCGKEVIPVNPTCPQVMGLKSYESLAAAPGPIDLVNVFRRAEFCPAVVRDAVAAGARGVWLQSGIVSPEARQLALEAGMDFVQNRCLMVEHMRHIESE